MYLRKEAKSHTLRNDSFFLFLPLPLGLAIFLIAFFQLWLTYNLATGYGCGGVPLGFSGCIDYAFLPPWQAWEKIWEAYVLLGLGTIIAALAIKRFHYTPKEMRMLGISLLIILIFAINVTNVA